MKVRILGSASGVPVPGRYNASVMVQVGESSYLFDAGEPCAATIHNSDADLFSLKSVFISHCHADHIGGLPMLLQVAWLCESDYEECRFTPDNSLKIYMPSDSIASFRGFLRALRLGEGKLPYKLRIEAVEEGTFYRDDDVQVSAQLTTHLSSHRVLDEDGQPYSEQAYSFVLEGEGKSLVYSADLGSASDIAGVSENADIVIVECAHFSPEELLEALPTDSIKRIIVTHVHPVLCRDEERILRAASNAGARDVIVAHDGLEVEI